MSAATKDALAQADIIFNRTNVALARSQRLIASWLPPKPEADEHQASTNPTADEDEDFRGDSEIGGIGSRAQKDDSGLPEGAFKRRNPGANDKLLDSLLGKKAANAHRKAQALAKSGMVQGQDAPKPIVKEKPKRSTQDSDSEEEGGRAAAFRSKRAKPSQPQPKSNDEDAEGGANVDTDTPEENESKAIVPTFQPPQEPSTAAKSNGRKRPASYLDELLGAKANKKNKKKNKSAAANGG